ncbi:MAG: transposase [Deltaproteobacteria bacterium]|nr:transposase [Deltaproteobacteria bacterium]
MARLPRVVIPGVPHHVTHRGNRRQRTFFSPVDYQSYLTLVSRFCRSFGVEIWCYCLMPNHVHLILTPSTEDGLARAVGRTAESFSRIVNAREDWRGHLWQGRFSSFPMGESHLLAAAKYILLNPVRAGIVDRPEHWIWSSVHAHLEERCRRDVIDVAPLAERISDWPQILEVAEDGQYLDEMRLHGRTGRPLGDESFIRRLEAQTGRQLWPLRPGPKPKAKGA